jgi:hypothetical protein
MTLQPKKISESSAATKAAIQTIAKAERTIVKIGGIGTILYVGTGQQYTTIAAAITAASAGQKVIILSGIYNENITAKDGVIIEGESSTTTEINGTFTFSGNNDVKELTIGNLTIGSGVNAKVRNCIVKTGANKITANAGKIEFINCDSSIEYDEPSIRLSGTAIVIFRDCKRFGGKILMTNDARMESYNSNHIYFRTDDYFVSQFDNSYSYWEASTSRGRDTGTGLEIDFGRWHRVVNNAVMEVNNYDCRSSFSIANSAKVIGSGFRAMYDGRLEIRIPSTSDCYYDLNDFYIHSDCGWQQGFHTIESEYPGTNDATYKLTNGILEFMGDKGKYPMTGNVIGFYRGNSEFKDVTIIDRGSNLNKTLSQAYQNMAIYALDYGKHFWDNVNIFWDPISNGGLTDLTGAIFLSNFAVSFTFNGSVTFLTRVQNRAAFAVLDILDYSKFNLNVKVTNCDLFKRNVAFYGSDELQYQKFIQHSANKSSQYTGNLITSAIETNHLSVRSMMLRHNNNNWPTDLIPHFYGKGLKYLNDIFEIKDPIVAGSANNHFRNLNLSLPKPFFKAKGRISLKSDNSTYTHGYLEHVSGEPFDLYVDTFTAHYALFLIPYEGKYIFFRPNAYLPANGNIVAAHSWTPVLFDVLDTEYYIITPVQTRVVIRGAASNTNWFRDIYLILDKGITARTTQDVTYAEILMSVTLEGGDYIQLFNIKLHSTSGGANPTDRVNLITVSEVMKNSNNYPIAGYTNIAYEGFSTGTNNNRYVKIKIPGFNANDMIRVKFEFISALGIKDAWISRTGEIY